MRADYVFMVRIRALEAPHTAVIVVICPAAALKIDFYANRFTFPAIIYVCLNKNVQSEVV